MGPRFQQVYIQSPGKQGRSCKVTSRWNLQDEDGQGLVEYALIIVLIAVVVVGMLGVFGSWVNTQYSTIVGSF
jgi:pilus assembly protein Flp/PilA